MKKITLLVAITFVFICSGKAQTINCGSFCVSNVTIDTATDMLAVTITSAANAVQVNYPSVMVVNNAGDTIANITQQYYLFAQLPSSTVIHTIPTTDSSLAGLPYTIYFRDNIYFIGCVFTYPMVCFVGIEEATAENNVLIVAPNPATSSININLGELNHHTAIINVYDDKGQLVKTITTSTDTTLINTESLSDGIYFVTADVNGRRMKDKLVINH